MEGLHSRFLEPVASSPIIRRSDRSIEDQDIKSLFLALELFNKGVDRREHGKVDGVCPGAIETSCPLYL